MRLRLLRLFQSTLPVKGATRAAAEKLIDRAISIHAPCEGSDLCAPKMELFTELFQSTLPVKGATFTIIISIVLGRISIHAPCEGSDKSKVKKEF